MKIFEIQFCTASWRNDHSLQIWDYGSSKLIKTLDKSTNDSNGKSGFSGRKMGIPSRMNYSCKYFDENRVVLGGTLDDAMSLVNLGTGEVSDLQTG